MQDLLKRLGDFFTHVPTKYSPNIRMFDLILILLLLPSFTNDLALSYLLPQQIFISKCNPARVFGQHFFIFSSKIFDRETMEPGHNTTEQSPLFYNSHGEKQEIGRKET